MTKYKISIILVSLCISFSAFSDISNIQMSKSVKQFIESKGLKFEEVGSEIYLVKGEVPVLIFDKDAKYIVEVLEDERIVVESELSKADIILGTSNIYVTFLNKAKGKKIKRVL